MLAFIIVFTLIISLCQIVDSLSIGVWDNVLSSKTSDYIHQACKELGSNQHFLFSRPLPEKSGPIETVLDSILTELGDDSRYVEYWTRQEWRSIEAHADVDEFLAREQDADGNSSEDFRYPVNGHVLYLQRGSKVRGPTILFPDRRSGGDLLRSKSAENNSVEVVTVPVIPGRLLRFQGDYLHAVPRPHDLWFLKFVKGAPNYDPEEEWGRGVVLFNTWGDEPPSDVSENTSSKVNNNNTEALHVCEDRSIWSVAYSQSSDIADESCEIDESAEWLAAKIWLLGNERRRDHPMRTLKLLAPENAKSAMGEESIVTRFLLKQH